MNLYAGLRILCPKKKLLWCATRLVGLICAYFWVAVTLKISFGLGIMVNFVL